MSLETAVKPNTKMIWLIAFTIMLPTAFAMLATSATNVALPHIAGTFGSTRDEVNWVVTSYMIANAIFLPLTGWLERTFGRRNFLKVFISIFVGGSIFCALAPSLNMLILGRIIQGIGGGPLMPIAQSILLQTFPSNQKGTAMAIFAFAVMIASILGPTFGGFLVDNLFWQWIFIINIPVGIISVILVHCNIEEIYKRCMPDKVDWVGLVSLVTWLLCMQIVLDKGQQYGWFDCTWICWLSGISVFAMVFFIVWELESPDAIVNLRVFKNLNFMVGTILGSFVNMIIYVTIVLLPMYLQSMMGYTALSSGLSLAPRAISCLVMLFIVGKMVNYVDNRFMIAIGFFFLGLSTFMYTCLNLTTSFGYIIVPNILLGVGVIFTFIPLSALTLGTLPKSEMSNGAGLHSLSKCVATSFTVSLSSALIARLSQVHQTHMSGHLNIFNPVFQAKAGILSSKLAVFYNPVIAAKKANIILYHQLLEQARLFSFSNVFQIFAIIGLILIPLAFVLQVKTEPNSQ